MHDNITRNPPKHVAVEPPKTAVEKALHHLTELVSADLAVAIIHCVLTAMAVFGLTFGLGDGGGGH